MRRLARMGRIGLLEIAIGQHRRRGSGSGGRRLREQKSANQKNGFHGVGAGGVAGAGAGELAGAGALAEAGAGTVAGAAVDAGALVVAGASAGALAPAGWFDESLSERK